MGNDAFKPRLVCVSRRRTVVGTPNLLNRAMLRRFEALCPYLHRGHNVSVGLQIRDGRMESM